MFRKIVLILFTFFVCNTVFGLGSGESKVYPKGEPYGKGDHSGFTWFLEGAAESLAVGGSEGILRDGTLYLQGESLIVHGGISVQLYEVLYSRLKSVTWPGTGQGNGGSRRQFLYVGDNKNYSKSKTYFYSCNNENSPIENRPKDPSFTFTATKGRSYTLYLVEARFSSNNSIYGPCLGHIDTVRFTVAQDLASPEIVIIKDQNYQIISNIGSRVFKSDETIFISAQDSGVGGAVVTKIVDKNENLVSPNGTLSLAQCSNGENTFKVEVKDALGNTGTHNFSVWIDKQGPNKPVNTRFSFASTNGSELKLLFRTGPATDRPASHASGTNLYRWKVGSQIESVLISNPHQSINDSIINFDYSRLSSITKNNPNQVYSITVGDKFGNTSTYRYPIYLAEPLLISDINYSDPVLNGNSLTYPVRLKFITPSAYQSAAAFMVDYNKYVGDERIAIFNVNESASLSFLSFDPAAQGLKVDNNTLYIDLLLSERIGGQEINHEKLAFRMDINPNNPDSTPSTWLNSNGQRNPVWLSGNSTNANSMVPNYFGSYEIVLPVNPSGLDVVCVKEKTLEHIDQEGDSFKYRLTFNYGLPLYSNYKNANETSTFDFKAPGLYRFGADIIEFDTSKGFESNILSLPADYSVSVAFPQSFSMLVGEKENGIVADKSYFGINSQDQNHIEFAAELNTGSNQRSTISELFVVDIDKYKSEVHRLIPPGDPNRANFNADFTDIEGFMSGANLSHLLSMPSNLGIISGPISPDSNSMFSINKSYLYQASKGKALLLLAYQGEQCIPRIIWIDNIPPQSVSQESVFSGYSFLNNDPNKIELNYTPASNIPLDVYRFELWYKGVKKVAFDRSHSSNVVVDLNDSSLAPNQEINFDLYAFDEAGNRSNASLMKAYSAAQIISDEYIVFDAAKNTFSIQASKPEYSSFVVKKQGGSALGHVQADGKKIYTFERNYNSVKNDYDVEQYTVTSFNNDGVGISYLYSKAPVLNLPVITLLNDDGFHGPYDAVSFSVTDSDDDDNSFIISYSLNGGSWLDLEPGKRSIQIDSSLNPGENCAIQLRAKTKRENIYEYLVDSNFAYNFVYDNQTPHINLDTIVYKNTLDIQFINDAITDDKSSVDIHLKVNGVSAEYSTAQPPYLNLKEGSLSEGHNTVLIEYSDQSNNSGSKEIDFVYDTTKPVITAIRFKGKNLNLNESNFSYQTNGGLLEFDISDNSPVADVMVGNDILNGVIHKDTNTSNSTNGFNIPSISDNTVTWMLDAQSDGWQTIFNLRIFDKAGNYIDTDSKFNTFNWDQSPPLLYIDYFHGSNSEATQYFQSGDSSSFSYKWDTILQKWETPLEQHFGFDSTAWGVRKAGTDIYSWSYGSKSDPPNFHPSIFTSEGAYEFVYKATNKVGLTSQIPVATLIYTKSNPVISNISLTSQGDDVIISRSFIDSRNSLTMNINANSGAGFIKYYELSIGNDNDPNSVSRNMIGSTDGVIKFNSDTIILDLPETLANGRYNIFLKAFNQYGNSTSYENYFNVNNDTAKITIESLPNITSNDKLRIIYSAIEGFQANSFTVSIYNEVNNLLHQNITTNSYYTVNKLSDYLNSGDSFYIEVSSTVNGTKYSSRTNKITLDLTKPVVSFGDIPQFTKTAALRIPYTITDNESGVDYIEYRIGAYIDNKFEYSSWDIQQVNSGVFTVSGMLENTFGNTIKSVDYKYEIRGFNNAGLVSDSIETRLIKWDPVKPLGGSIYRSTKVPYHSLVSPLKFGYNLQRQNLGANLNVDYFEYGLSVNGEAPENWTRITESGNIGSINFEFTESRRKELDGASLYGVLRAVAFSGMHTDKWSEAIIVDPNAPDITDVTILNSSFHNLVPTSTLKDIEFTMSITDATSTKVNYQLCQIINNEVVPVGEPHEEAYVPNKIYNLSYIPDNILAELGSGKFLIEVIAFDLAENKTLYSGRSIDQQILYEKNPFTRIENTALNTTYIGSDPCFELRFDVITNTYVPLSKNNFSVVVNGVELPVDPIIIGNSAYFLKNEIDKEGTATFKINVSDLLGKSASATASIVHDLSPPTVSIDLDNSDAFVFNNYSFSGIVEENYSKIKRIEYYLGTIVDKSFLSNGIKEIPISISAGLPQPDDLIKNISESIDFDNTGLTDMDSLVLTLVLVNEHGLSSEKSFDSIIVDVSPPEIIIDSLPSYTRVDDSIGIQGVDDLNVFVNENVSDVTNIYYKLSSPKSSMSSWEEVADVQIISVDSKNRQLVSIALPSSIRLEEYTSYDLQLKASNSARNESSATMAGQFRTDFTAPEIVITPTINKDISNNIQFDLPGIVGFESILDRYIANETGNVEFTYSFVDSSIDTNTNWNEVISINSFEVVTSIDRLGLMDQVLAGGDKVSFPVNVDDELRREYIVNISFSDAAGHNSTETWKVYANQAPQVFINTERMIPKNGINYIPTTPGKPLTIYEHITFYDSEGHSGNEFIYSTEHAKDPSDLLVDLTNIDVHDVNASYQVAYLHTDAMNSAESFYMNEISVIAVDEFGKKSNKTSFPVLVHNTHEGTLFCNEFWMGEHFITNSIEVPADITLTLLGDTVAKVQQHASETPIGIEIKGKYDSKVGSIITVEDQNGPYWKGISFEGQDADVSGTISYAERAITILSKDISINSATFNANKIGLHLFTEILIEDSTFKNNLHYAIKEDKNIAPSLIRCEFIQNGFDYYDYGGALFNETEINSNGNYGNNSDKGEL